MRRKTNKGVVSCEPMLAPAKTANRESDKEEEDCIEATIKIGKKRGKKEKKGKIGEPSKKKMKLNKEQQT